MKKKEVEFNFGQGKRELKIIAKPGPGGHPLWRAYRIRPKRIAGQEVAIIWFKPEEAAQISHIARSRLGAQ